MSDLPVPARPPLPAEFGADVEAAFWAEVQRIIAEGDPGLTYRGARVITYLRGGGVWFHLVVRCWRAVGEQSRGQKVEVRVEGYNATAILEAFRRAVAARGWRVYV